MKVFNEEDQVKRKVKSKLECNVWDQIISKVEAGVRDDSISRVYSKVILQVDFKALDHSLDQIREDVQNIY